ncbi:hypothetical protein N3K66_005374 [Trichothecium roseum]|uniref:Uncharacterized protein n=1 Tax=Trichothecium roseum TaxID=47278 RepID=A0ACC0UXP5_9HYPO|nr:hypothetical protein N3K66_005374 [Trichothecium roseum]
MAPTFLIIGATGNTGRSTVSTLSRLIQQNPSYAQHRILALTRTPSSPAAQHLATLPGVQVVEKAWAEITPSWLREHAVERAFVASHIQPSHFAEETTFLVAALAAGVRYVVRVSTSASNVRPDTPVYYARMHWAVEAMLSTPEFASLKWTALQPNAFTPLYLWTASDFVKEVRATGKQPGPLRLMAAEDVPVAPVHPDDIGEVAAHLLADDDFAAHDQARYVLNGPEDIDGQYILKLVEDAIGAKVENVVYKDMSLVESMVAATSESPNVIGSIRYAQDTTWEGKGTTSTTSEEVRRMGLLRRTVAETFKTMIQ